MTAFVQELAQLGCVKIDSRWSAGDSERVSRYGGARCARAGRHRHHQQPGGRGVDRGHPRRADRVRGHPRPVGAGFVNSLARPGGNVTGFLLFEYGLSGKWLELLKQIAPQTTRVGMIRDPTVAAAAGYFGVIRILRLRSGAACETASFFAAISAGNLGATAISPLWLWVCLPHRRRPPGPWPERCPY
jgi:ABC transporter substrate binding protein